MIVLQLTQSLPFLPPVVRRDAIFYQLFQRYPALFFELIGQSPASKEGYRFESVEVKEPTFRIDGVFLPPKAASPQVVFFCEVQFQKDESLYHRFFAELFLYLYRNQERYQNWYGVLIFPRRGLEPQDPTIHQSLLADDRLQVIYLDELGRPENLPLGLQLVQLTIAEEAQIAEQARRIIDQARQGDADDLDPTAIIEIAATITAYKFTNLTRDEVNAMLGITFEQTRIYQEAKEEGREEGREEGHQAEKLAIARNLLKLGLPLDQIAIATGLTLAEIQSLRDTPPNAAG